VNLDIVAVTDALASHALSTGHFDRVNRAELRSSPGLGMHAAVWFQNLTPIQRRSGLAATSALLVMHMRIYQSMVLEPRDMIDPDLVRAVTTLLAAYTGDFQLGGNVSHVDLLGAYGQPLDAMAAYLEIDGVMIRVLDIVIPLVVDDVWTQSP
jgi:hypothetical protein